jgi:hypothetical protein
MGSILVQRDNEQSGMKLEIAQIVDELKTMRALEGKKIDLACA